MTRHLRTQFTVPFAYDIVFTRNLLDPANPALRDAIAQSRVANGARPSRMLIVLDDGVAAHHPALASELKDYAVHHADAIELAGEPIEIPGGETCKNDVRQLETLWRNIDARGICRHSFVVAIGGGAVLDVVGFAAATAHRGVRHVRIPTTTLAQADSAVGVKNGVNAVGKKNFLGSFAPPVAVLNDANFLTTLEDRDWRAGIAEAIKVALLKDSDFFVWIEESMPALAGRDLPAMERLVRRSAELHSEHIGASGDPFELGSSRPLDFGHWAAHKLELLSGHELRHGEAVAVGLALDLMYSYIAGILSGADLERTLDALDAAGFNLYSPLLKEDDGRADTSSRISLSLLAGLEDFREHLGGELTVMLLAEIGRGVESHSMDHATLNRAVAALEERSSRKEIRL